MELALLTFKSFGRISAFFATLTIVTASVGLFGLILFSVKRKTKEIGVRKVYGSSVFSIFTLLAVEIIKMIGIALFIVIPLAWYLHDTMPSAYKSPLTVWEFALATTILSVVSLLTIGWHIYRAARINPVDALRYE